jgi:hypothetical protein
MSSHSGNKGGKRDGSNERKKEGKRDGSNEL